MKAWLRQAVWLLAAVAVGLLLVGWAGAVHPAGDALAVLRWQIAAGVALAAALLSALGARRAVWLLLPAAVAAAQTGWAYFKPAPDVEAPAPLVLYQKNLNFSLSEVAALADDIRGVRPDVLTLQEVSGSNRALLRLLADILPTQHVCPFARIGAVAVATRWPEVPGTLLCLERAGVVAVQVETGAGRLWLISLHLHWPWPHAQAAQVDAIVPELAALEGPMLIGGDFNMVPWGASLARLAAATGTRRIGRALNTFPHFGPLLPLPIDHVLAPQGAAGRVAPRPRYGSDHLGLWAEIAL